MEENNSIIGKNYYPHLLNSNCGRIAVPYSNTFSGPDHNYILKQYSKHAVKGIEIE